MPTALCGQEPDEGAEQRRGRERELLPGLRGTLYPPPLHTGLAILDLACGSAHRDDEEREGREHDSDTSYAQSRPKLNRK